MARFCGKCGAAANDKATFCNKCGERLLQRKAIRYSRAEAPAVPVNPYAAQVEPAPPRGPVGVQPAVRRPGRRQQPPPAPPRAPSPTGPQHAPPPEVEPSDTTRPYFAAVDEDPQAKARQTVRNFSLWAAGICLTAGLLPFSDLVLLIPVQSAMILNVARIFGVQDPPEKILAYIAATSGISVFGEVTFMIVKGLFPFIGSLVGAPFIYGWTYGLGEVAIRYFQSQGQISGDEMKAVFRKASKQAHGQYGKEKKVSKEESLEALREHLPPEEYERLRGKFGVG